MSTLPLWLIFLLTLGLVLVAAEIGYRAGELRQKAATREKEAPVGGMVGASLGLLAFLLAFTFGFGANIFQAKREAMLEESNAIGTAFLRTDFLPAAERLAARDQLRNYVDIRLAAAESGNFEDAMQRSDQIHATLWADAVTVASGNPTAVMALYVDALNKVVDQHSTRVMVALRSQIPKTIWIALYGIAFFAFGTMGYHSGLATTPRSYAILAVAIIFSSVIWLIADLDTSQQGVLRISQQTMFDLRNTMNAP